MPAAHVKVSLPPELGIAVRRDAQRRGRSVSSLIAEAVAQRYAEEPRPSREIAVLQEVAILQLKLTLAVFRSVSALVAMAPRIAEDGRRQEITRWAAEHRAAVLAGLDLSEEELLELSGNPAD